MHNTKYEEIIQIERKVNKSEEKRYLEVPFTVEEDIEKIEVSFRVVECDGQESQESVIDLGVKDENQVRGWSGGARDNFYITKEQSTPGYIAGSIDSGEWAVLLGTYKVSSQGCVVKITVKKYKKHFRWIKGDLHTHTEHSDGTYKLVETEGIAKAEGLDYIALTDHNTTSQNYAYVPTQGVVFIPSVELTTYWGHANFLGIKNPIKDFRCESTDEVKNKISEAKESGATIVLNHPFCDYCGWLVDWDVEFDAVEIWNGPWRPINEAALNWWQKELSLGKKINIVGGSDVHREEEYVHHGSPTTWVWVNERSQSNILDAISKGHSFTSYSPTGPRIDIQCEEYIMGSTMSKADPVSIKCEELQREDIVKIISNEGLVKEYKVVDGENTFAYLAEADNASFIRVEIWRYFKVVEGYLLGAVSNPIYFK